MPQAGFEPTISLFERAKTLHALHRAANMIGLSAFIDLPKYLSYCKATYLSVALCIFVYTTTFYSFKLSV
jgi:hypothetical protein